MMSTLQCPIQIIVTVSIFISFPLWAIMEIMVEDEFLWISSSAFIWRKENQCFMKIPLYFFVPVYWHHPYQHFYSSGFLKSIFWNGLNNWLHEFKARKSSIRLFPNFIHKLEIALWALCYHKKFKHFTI